MPQKRTQAKTTKNNFRTVWKPIENFFAGLYDVLKNIITALYTVLKNIAQGLLILIEKILRFVVDVIFATAKIIQAVGVAFFAVAASAFLVVLAGYLFAKAVDLPASKNFQEFREQTWEILIEAAEPDFAAWRADAQAWITYREELQKLYASNLSQEEKVQKLTELKETLHRAMDEGDPNALEMRIKKGL